MANNELDRIPNLTMASKAMRLKSRSKSGSPSGSMGDASTHEISPRRQVGDAESMVYAPTASTKDPSQVPWWRREGIEEGM